MKNPAATVLITGATRGLGKALAERLSACGAPVLAHGRNAGRFRADLTEALLHLATAPEMQAVSGQFFDGRRAAGAHPLAYDEAARGELRSLRLELSGLS